MTHSSAKLLIFCSVLLAPMPALAYIGPGVGAGAFAAVVGVILSIFLALFAVLYYPFKRMMRKRKAAANAEAETSTKDT